MDKNIHLFLIDVQNDFCIPNKAALYVANAEKDCERTAKFIEKYNGEFKKITCTLDSHSVIHVGHGVWWLDENNNHPDPGTQISHQSVLDGAFRSANPKYQSWALEYTEKLETQTVDDPRKKYNVQIWPEHCIIGTWGWCMVEPVVKAINEWERKYHKANMITKGSNPFVEHYSAVKAEVIRPGERNTMLNEALINILKEDDCEIVFAGQALSHCVAATMRDVVEQFDVDQLKKFTLLTDASSPVIIPGIVDFTPQGEEFVSEMKDKGLKLATTENYFGY